MFNLLKRLIGGNLTHAKVFGAWLWAVYALYFAIIGALLTFQIGSGQLLPGYSPAELAAAEISSSWPHLLENFVYWPYYAAAYILGLGINDGLLAGRLASTLFALTAVGAFLWLMRHKFGVLVSLAGTSLFALNSWFLQLGRSGTPEISNLALGLILVACLFAIPTSSGRNGRLLKLAALAAAFLAWSTPLLPWLIIAIIGHFFYRHWLTKRYLSRRLRLTLVVFLGGLGIWTAVALAGDQGMASALTGLPEQPPAPAGAATNLLQSLQGLVWRAADNPGRWLANFPLLDVFAAALVPFSLYSLARHRRRATFKYSLLVFAGLLAVAALNDGLSSAGLMLILPLLAAAAAAGLHELLEAWRRVFPQNPLARIISLSLVLVLVSMSVFYQGKRYFVAWANHPETRQIYSLEEEGG